MLTYDCLRIQLVDTAIKYESKRYVWLWGGKMLQSIEHVGTSKEVIAILLVATDKKSDVLFQINPVDQKHSTASEQTKIILDTLDKWKIERDLIIGLVLDTTSINAGNCSGVAVFLEQIFGTKLLLLACRHHVLALLSGAAASMIYSITKSLNEAVFQVLVNRWSVLDKINFQVYKAKCRKEKIEIQNIVEFCQTILWDDFLRKDYQEMLELTIISLGYT